MKKIVVLILLQAIFCNLVYADCDWTAIKPMANGSYEYVPALHLCVGNLVVDNKILVAQLVELNAAIELKNLALNKADARTELWRKTSDSEQDRLSKIQDSQKTNDLLWFGLGILSTVAVGMMTARLIGRRSREREASTTSSR